MRCGQLLLVAGFTITLSLQALGGDAVPVLPGEYKTGDLQAGEQDTYAFSANAGDAVTVLAGVGSGNLDPEVQLHDPDGAVVATAWGSSEATIQAVKITVTGTYLIVVRDHWGRYNGEYSLSLARELRAGTPEVGMVSAEPDALVRGEDLTLRAEDVSDANGAIVQVEF